MQELLSSVEDEFLRLTMEKSQTEAQEQELLKSAEENFLKLSTLGPDSDQLEFNLVSQEKSKNDDGFEFDDDLVFEEPKPSPIRKKNLDDPLVMQESPTAPAGKNEIKMQGSPDLLIATKKPCKNFALEVKVAGG